MRQKKASGKTEIDISTLVRCMLNNARDTLQYRVGNMMRNCNDPNYNYIPVEANTLARLITHLIKLNIPLKGKNFMDIGCGTDIIMNIFKILMMNSYGLEYDIINVKLTCNSNVIEGNLLTFDKYSEYDVLYAYNPIYDIKLMEQGLHYIVNNMKSGAIFYFVSAGISHKFLESLGMSSIDGGCVYYIQKQ